MRTLGVNLASVDATSGFKFGIGQGAGPKQFVPGSPGGLGVGVTTGPGGGTVISAKGIGSTLGFAGRMLGLDIAGALDLAETEGLVTTLAQPNLTALSGETAEFLAGGEFPIPLSQGLGTTTIEYKNYGISLAYSPTVLANGRIQKSGGKELALELEAKGYSWIEEEAAV